MSDMRSYRKGQAKTYFLQHPEASIKEALAELHRRGINIGERTVAQARSELAQKNLIPSGRNANVGTSDPQPTLPAFDSMETKDTPAKDVLLDDKTLAAFAEGKDILDLDDEEIRKLLLRKIIRIAMSPGLHPDTQLSASQAWIKLKDMARVADLGPGKPLTREAALARLVDLLQAVGSELALEAMYKAFNLKETSGEETNVEASTADGATEDSGSSNDDPPSSQAS